MPVIVELLNEATYQDQQDLQKIYRDAPDAHLDTNSHALVIEEKLVTGGVAFAVINFFKVIQI